MTVGQDKVFTNAEQLCTLLTSEGQLNGMSDPPLVSSTQSILKWFNPAGIMPQGSSTTTPPNAVQDIRAWATAGAACP